jgi:uncharacterized membrane protein
MNFQILIGLLLTVVPIFELRGGLPIIVEYCVRNDISVWPYFILVLILNVLLIFVVFFFLDFLHHLFMRVGIYRRFFERILLRFQKKVDKFEKKFAEVGYLALLLFVAVPLPGTGAWTGVLLAWLFGLERLKSFVAIAAGVIIAGILILFASLGIFSGLY